MVHESHFNLSTYRILVLYIVVVCSTVRTCMQYNLLVAHSDVLSDCTFNVLIIYST